MQTHTDTIKILFDKKEFAISFSVTFEKNNEKQNIIEILNFSELNELYKNKHLKDLSIPQTFYPTVFVSEEEIFKLENIIFNYGYRAILQILFDIDIYPIMKDIISTDKAHSKDPKKIQKSIIMKLNTILSVYTGERFSTFIRKKTKISYQNNIFQRAKKKYQDIWNHINSMLDDSKSRCPLCGGHKDYTKPGYCWHEDQRISRVLIY